MRKIKKTNATNSKMKRAFVGLPESWPFSNRVGQAP